jgi:hypothetical protein
MSTPTHPASTPSPLLNGNNSDSPNDTETEAHRNGSDEYASDPQDASLVELTSEDFPSYFSERDDHLFHSSSSPYPLPVDGPEQQVLSLIVIASVVNN